MSGSDGFDGIVLTETHAELGEKLASEQQRMLFETLAKSDKLIFTTSCVDIVTTDVYGPVTIQSIGNEDRLHFPKNKTHAHVKWSRVYEAKRVTLPDHPMGSDTHWIGIEFFTRTGESIFSIWNLKGDQEFSDDAYELLGTLI